MRARQRVRLRQQNRDGHVLALAQIPISARWSASLRAFIWDMVWYCGAGVIIVTDSERFGTTAIELVLAVIPLPRSPRVASGRTQQPLRLPVRGVTPST